MPKHILNTLNVRIGSIIDIDLDATATRVIIDIPRKPNQTKINIDREVYTVANDLLKRYLPAFKKLAKPHDEIPHH